MANDDVAIRLAGVGKRYIKLDEQPLLIKSLVPFWRPRRSDLWALRDVNFTVAPGETLGLVGRNGAGKTTLLQLLAGVTQPSEGRVTVVGRIAPLISIGVGFHREMSGRENVFVNGMVLGLTHAQLQRRFDEIVAFAELEEFIDTPVKFYSSGMFMRLGFSIAIHADPSILLVDEVLAVGDIAFQLKCLERMRSLQWEGTTIVIVSHSMHAIRLLCPRVVLLRFGQIDFDGDVEPGIARHHELLTIDADHHAPPDTDGTGKALRPPVRVVESRLVGSDGPTSQFRQGDRLTLRARLEFEQWIESPQVYFSVATDTGTLAYSMKTVMGRDWQTFAPGETAEVEASFVAHLAGGTYRVQLLVTDRDGRRHLAVDPGLLLYLPPPLGSEGIADLDATITINGHELTDHQPLTIDRLEMKQLES